MKSLDFNKQSVASENFFVDLLKGVEFIVVEEKFKV